MATKKTGVIPGKVNVEQTSKKAATAASQVLRSKTASKAAKTAAGSALTQAPAKKRKS